VTAAGAAGTEGAADVPAISAEETGAGAADESADSAGSAEEVGGGTGWIPVQPPADGAGPGAAPAPQPQAAARTAPGEPGTVSGHGGARTPGASAPAGAPAAEPEAEAETETEAAAHAARGSAAAALPGPRGAEGPGNPPEVAGRAPGETAETPAHAAVPLPAALEAILMIADEPVTEAHLAQVLERPKREVGEALRALSAAYTAEGRGFDLRFVAGGWRYYTRAACAPAVDRYVLDGQQARLTQAALETLAVVAYRQPVSRSRVSAVRGVNCDGVMRTLVQRGLVEEAGSESETGAILYRTTNYFLERMGLRGLDELPELAPFLPEAEDVEADSQEGSAIAEALVAARAADGDEDADAGPAGAAAGEAGGIVDVDRGGVGDT